MSKRPLAHISQASDEDEGPRWVRPGQLGPELSHLAKASGDIHCWDAVFRLRDWL